MERASPAFNPDACAESIISWSGWNPNKIIIILRAQVSDFFLADTGHLLPAAALNGVIAVRKFFCLYRIPFPAPL
jgi:hypothetical protein